MLYSLSDICALLEICKSMGKLYNVSPTYSVTQGLDLQYKTLLFYKEHFLTTMKNEREESLNP